MRESSFIKINRSLVEQFGHFPAMVADCVRHQIEYHLAAELDDERFVRQVNGHVYVNTPGQFIANWLMCDRSTVRKCLLRLIDAELLHQDFFTGRNGGSWLAFNPVFIATSNDFFDYSVRKLLVSIYTKHTEKEAEKPPPAVVDNSEPGGDIITTGGDNITAGGDDITATPIYNTNPQNQHPKGAGFVDISFLNETDLHHKKEILAILAKYDEREPVEMIKAALSWKSCADRTAIKINELAATYGFPILCAAAVFAFNEKELHSPLRYLETVCARLRSQQVGNLQRRNLQRSQSKHLVMQ